MLPPTPAPVEEESTAELAPKFIPDVAKSDTLPPLVEPWLLIFMLPLTDEIDELDPPATINRLPPLPEPFCELTLPPKAIEPDKVTNEKLLPDVLIGALIVKGPAVSVSKVFTLLATTEVALRVTPLDAESTFEPVKLICP